MRLLATALLLTLAADTARASLPTSLSIFAYVQPHRHWHDHEIVSHPNRLRSLDLTLQRELGRRAHNNTVRRFGRRAGDGAGNCKHDAAEAASLAYRVMGPGAKVRLIMGVDLAPGDGHVTAQLLVRVADVQEYVNAVGARVAFRGIMKADGAPDRVWLNLHKSAGTETQLGRREFHYYDVVMTMPLRPVDREGRFEVVRLHHYTGRRFDERDPGGYAPPVEQSYAHAAPPRPCNYGWVSRYATAEAMDALVASTPPLPAPHHTREWTMVKVFDQWHRRSVPFTGEHPYHCAYRRALTP